MVWRRILIGFGHYLPVAPATRIWSTSELARYLPGVIWQVAGRVYLVKPYGVRGSVCTDLLRNVRRRAFRAAPIARPAFPVR